MYLFYVLSKKQTLKNQNYNSNNDNTNNHIYIKQYPFMIKVILISYNQIVISIDMSN